MRVNPDKATEARLTMMLSTEDPASNCWATPFPEGSMLMAKGNSKADTAEMMASKIQNVCGRCSK